MRFIALLLTFLLAIPVFSKPSSAYIELSNKHVPWWQALGYEYAFKSSAQKFHVSPSWLMAMAQIENGFKSIGTDGKGSYGIMQLQVSTAKIVAKGLGDSNWDLIDGYWLEDHPEESIRFAACHMRDLLNIFHNDYYYATRAYNAGAQRIKLAKKGSKKWKHLSEKYYNNVLVKFKKIKEQ